MLIFVEFMCSSACHFEVVGSTSQTLYTRHFTGVVGTLVYMEHVLDNR